MNEGIHLDLDTWIVPGHSFIYTVYIRYIIYGNIIII